VSSACSVLRGYKETEKVVWVSFCQELREFGWRRVLLSYLSRTGSSSGDGSRRWLRRNGKKCIRLSKYNFMYNLKLQRDGYKSVARIRPVKIENPSPCVTVNCKMCRSEIALYYLQPRVVNIRIRCNKSNHPIKNPSYKTRTHTLNSVALVRKRTIATERQPLVGKVSAKFCE
jgi:hypothetical protein